MQVSTAFVAAVVLVLVSMEMNEAFSAEKVNFMKEALRLSRHKRQAVTSVTPECIYCASGVIDLFPNWDNCSQFNLCTDGQVIPLDCSFFGNSRYYNPMKKYCENSTSLDNICLFRFNFQPSALG